MSEIDRLRARVNELEAQLRGASIPTPPDEDGAGSNSNDSSPDSVMYNSEGVQLDTTVAIQSSTNTQFYGPSSTYYFIHCISLHLKAHSSLIAAQSPDAHALIPNSVSRSMANVIWTHNAESDEAALSGGPGPATGSSASLSTGLTEKTLSGRDLSATQEAFFLDLFWDSWHCCYQLLDESELKAHYKSLWAEPIRNARKDSALVDIVLALCMQFGVTSLPRQSGCKAEVNSRDAAIAGRWLFQRCQRLIASDLERPTLETFQCQLWSAIYLSNASYQNMAQNMLGVAARTAYTLGLHVEPGNELPPREREARKRAWCILYMFETRSCIRLGRPWVTQTQQITPFIPSGGSRIPSGGVAQLGYTSERAKLTEIARAGFDDAFNHRSRAVSSEASPQSQDQSRAYYAGMQRLRAWAEALPGNLKTARRGDGKPLSTDLSDIEIEPFAPIWLCRQRLMLELFYHELMLTLGRHFIGQSLTRTGYTCSPEMTKLAETSALHAAATTQLLYQVYQEYDILNGWYEPFNCQWNAAITLVGYLLTTHNDSAVVSVAHTALSQSITVLERMGEFFGTASSAAGVIKTLHQKLNTPFEAQVTDDNNTVTTGVVHDINFNGWEDVDMSLEGTLGTFGIESELEILGFGINLEPLRP
ncbi:hypothetical protein IL306_012358 [Fusarium sp. DS 682]|nr:hypothetical protein IL306_012358 [Fusarium sp. DS 682]